MFGIHLFLTFFIDIRFLVKPDTSRVDTFEKDRRLGIRGILVSLFFGLTIGFGTGFVGTGGGMMMLLCIVIATAASLISAQFANRVNSRTVGLVTGAVLTVLGGAMLILNYWDLLSRYLLLMQTLDCLWKFLVYIVPCVAVLLLIKYIANI